MSSTPATPFTTSRTSGRELRSPGSTRLFGQEGLRIWDVVYNFDPADAETRLEAWCSTGGPPDAEGWSRDDYEEHVRDEHSTYTWVFEALAQRAVFLVDQTELYSNDGIFAKYVLRRS